jgi:hypothetical protein
LAHSKHATSEPHVSYTKASKTMFWELTHVDTGGTFFKLFTLFRQRTVHFRNSQLCLSCESNRFVEIGAINLDFARFTLHSL